MWLNYYWGREGIGNPVPLVSPLRSICVREHSINSEVEMLLVDDICSLAFVVMFFELCIQD